MRDATLIAAKKTPKFANKEEAWDWLDEAVDDPCVDNYRFYFDGDTKAAEQY